VEFIFQDLRNGYVDLARHVRDSGQPVSVRGMPTREVLNTTVIMADPLAPMLPIGVGRKINTRLATVEALQLIAGEAHHDLLTLAAPNYARVLVDSNDPNYGAYGPRTLEQLTECVDLLAEDPTTRQAVVMIWNGDDLVHVGDKPCTVFMQFIARPLNRHNEPLALELHVFMRSQDVWLGVPYDYFMFTQLQHTVARELKIPAGRYVHHVTSLHLYERDIAAVDQLHHVTDEIDDLPLGVVSVGEEEDGFTVASYLLWDVGSTVPISDELERGVNGWFVDRLDKLHEDQTNAQV